MCVNTVVIMSSCMFGLVESTWICWLVGWCSLYVYLMYGSQMVELQCGGGIFYIYLKYFNDISLICYLRHIFMGLFNFKNKNGIHQIIAKQVKWWIERYIKWFLNPAIFCTDLIKLLLNQIAILALNKQS